jgi:outer membrane protein TolC
MLTGALLVRTLARQRYPCWCVLLTALVGCSHSGSAYPQVLADRILAPPGVAAASASGEEGLPKPKAVDDERHRSDEAARTATQTPGGPDAPPTEPTSSNRAPCQPLTLPDAIAAAFRLQPRLRASLESIQQARGRDDIAFAAFLPTVSGAYLAGGYAIQAGGNGFSIPGVPNSPTFTVLPLLGTVPVGIEGQTGFEVAELKLQWLICDFGKRLARYNQAGIGADIAQLQTERAYQTVANDVATAYYQVLRARSLHRIATEAVRRAEDDLDVAQKLRRGGVIEREKVLRAEVALAQSQRGLDLAEEAEGVAVAALNLAIGFNVSAPTDVVDTSDVPTFTLGLTDCLQAAVSGRREFQVARASVQVAHEGTKAARADFAPRIVGEGSLLDFQQSSPRGHFDLPFALVKLEWGLFEGGKRVAELRVADSQVREALAQADSIADTIAFQVNQAYRQLVAARKGIDRSRPAVDQTREAYRLVVARSRQGDATPSELTDAEAALTRAEQDYANSVYDYLTAIERLQYAMGTTATPVTAGSHTN